MYFGAKTVPYRPVRACKSPRFELRRIVPKNVICISVSMYGRDFFAVMKFYLSPWYSVCTKEILISEGSYGYGEPKNLICISVQKPYRTVRACKSPRFELRRIVPSMDFLR